MLNRSRSPPSDGSEPRSPRNSTLSWSRITGTSALNRCQASRQRSRRTALAPASTPHGSNSIVYGLTRSLL